MIERAELAQRLPAQREALTKVISEFAEHVRTIHPRGIPATSCHVCGNYKWTIQMREIFVRDLENKISTTHPFILKI